MRLFGIVLSSNVQAERHGPSMTTRSPVARTAANSRKYWVTSPPWLERMRTSAKAGTRAASKTIIVKVTRRTGILLLLCHRTTFRRPSSMLQPGRVAPKSHRPAEILTAGPFTVWTLTGPSPSGVEWIDSQAARRTLPGSLSGFALRPHRGRPGGRQYAGWH